MALRLERKVGEIILVSTKKADFSVTVAAIEATGDKVVTLLIQEGDKEPEQVHLSLTQRPRVTLLNDPLAVLALGRVKASAVQLFCEGDRQAVTFLRKELTEF